MNSLIPQWFNTSLPDFSHRFPNWILWSLFDLKLPNLNSLALPWFNSSLPDFNDPSLIMSPPSWFLCPPPTPFLFPIRLWWPLTCRTSTCSCFALTADCWVADTTSSSWILSSSSRQRSLSALSSFSTFTRLVWHWFSLSSVRNCQRGKKCHLIEQIYCKQNFFEFKSTSW